MVLTFGPNVVYWLAVLDCCANVSISLPARVEAIHAQQDKLMENVQNLVNNLESLIRQQKYQKQALERLTRRQKRTMMGKRLDISASLEDADLEEDDEDEDEDDWDSDGSDY